jgi:beta-glucanase (GH16 family)
MSTPARAIVLAAMSMLACSNQESVQSGRDGSTPDLLSATDAPWATDASSTTDASHATDVSLDLPDTMAVADAKAGGDATTSRDSAVVADASADSAVVTDALANRDSGVGPEVADTSSGKDSAVGPDTARPAVDSGTAGAPTFSVEMTKTDQSLFYARATNGGSTTFGAANPGAADNAVAELVFKGNSSLGPSDKLSPDYATEIGTNQSFQYGTYRTRVQLARCTSSEELVNGIFTYFNDGKDHDGDGLVDNSEIDIEILCSDPSIISLTIWSEYTSDTAKKGVSRVIRTKTGDYEDSINDQTVTGSGNRGEFKIAGFPDPNAFYEMGFEWHADRIRYFLVLGDVEVTLWTFTDPSYIPSLPAAFLFNVWHSSDWWDNRGTADYPASDAVMRVDWFRYWKQ